MSLCHRMPDEVTVALTDLASVMFELERILQALSDRGTPDIADAVDAVIGRMTRWIWPLLGELDEEDAYDG
jgi:hypothetical protein